MTPRKRAARIRRLLGTIADHRDEVLALVQQAKEANDAEALGYPSWTAYVVEEFGGVLPRLDREDRRPLVVELRALGMSTRAVAGLVGVNHVTVLNDEKAGGESSPPAAPVGQPYATTTGLDGKTYVRPLHAVPDDDTEEAPEVPRKANPRRWASRIERISAEIPYADLTDEQLAEVMGAAQFLRNLVKGECVAREGRERKAAQ